MIRWDVRKRGEEGGIEGMDIKEEKLEKGKRMYRMDIRL